MTITVAKAKIASAIIAKECDVSTIQRCFVIWNHFLKEHDAIFSKNIDSSNLLYDYKTVLSIAETECERLGKSSALTVILAKDSLGQIQGIGCFSKRTKPSYESESFEISSVISAPWNIHWPCNTEKKGIIKGGGTLIIYSIYRMAIKAKTEKIALSSTASGISFYKKLGLAQTSYNRFCVDIEKPEPTLMITACFAKTFLLEEGSSMPSIEGI